MSALTPDEIGADLEDDRLEEMTAQTRYEYNGSKREATDALNWLRRQISEAADLEALAAVIHEWVGEDDLMADDLLDMYQFSNDAEETVKHLAKHGIPV